MKILIDIGHPAHVHYFKNFMRIMESKGHEFLVIARDREFIHQLLKAENISYINRGKGAENLLGKVLYTLKVDLLILWHALKFKPDIFLSHGPFYLLHISFFLQKPFIATGDTDHIEMNRTMMKLLSSYLTPSVFKKDYGSNHLHFNAYMEMMYLHPNYFSFNTSHVREILGVGKDEKYFLLRFIAWNAFHDVNQGGISTEIKYQLIELLSKHGKVFISSEIELPQKLRKYKAEFPPERLHEVLAEAHICISEGATTASESAILGTPTIYANSLEVSYCREQEEKYNLSWIFKNDKGLLDKVKELLNEKDLKRTAQKKREKLLRDKIDPTSFLVWFVENYPESKHTLYSDPNYQNRFS